MLVGRAGILWVFVGWGAFVNLRVLFEFSLFVSRGLRVVLVVIDWGVAVYDG